MNRTQTIPKTVDDYIAGFPDSVQACLRKVRATIKRAADSLEDAFSRFGKVADYVVDYDYAGVRLVAAAIGRGEVPYFKIEGL
jgi:hypothetical protein